MANTLFDKIWNEHSVSSNPGFPDTLYIDAHFINDVTSPGAFESLRKRGIPVFRPHQTIVKEPAHKAHLPVNDISAFRMDLLNRNCSDFGLNMQERSPSGDREHLVLPGQTIVCDHAHRNNTGAFGAIGLGISEIQVEQVLATQCLLLQKPKNMKIEVNGRLNKGLGAKDINHYLLSQISAQGATGYFIEYTGETIANLDMEERMAICNMSVEMGALGGIIAPDRITFDYLNKPGLLPVDKAGHLNVLVRDLYSDENSVFDEVLEFDAEDIGPGNYGIKISKLVPSLSGASGGGSVADKSYRVIESCIEMDYILSRKEDIEEFERSKTYKILNGVQYPFVEQGDV